MKVYLKEIKEKYPEFEIRNYDENVYFTAFNHDSRNIIPNDLFVPIVGEKFDGHDYIEEAFLNGCSVSFCESDKFAKLQNVFKPVILVDSVKEGLEKILNYSISSIKAPVIGITGSTGKTTTKEMLVHILEKQMTVLSGDHSNTVWGNAAILSRYTDEKAVVLEFGMDTKGEIAWHVNSSDPDIGVLLNIGDVHAEQLGSIEEIYKEKKDLADYMEKTSKPLILNIDDERLYRIKEGYNKGSKLITFGKREEADFVISNINVDDEGTHFSFSYYDNTVSVNLSVYGEGFVYDAMAAIITANLMHVSIDEGVHGVEEYESKEGRFQKLDFGNSVTIVNDAYNANPASMEMSVKTFNKLYKEKGYFTVVVLGDMKELGDVSVQKHKELGELVEEFGFDEVYFVGEMFEDFCVGETIGSVDEVAAMLNLRLEALKGKKVAILLKASHCAGLYQVPEFLNKLGVV
ncbi:MAG: UDP-N-acetylmuramoyl-tripeptide--D-alanyl-D-alanine ligase [Candidatus Dojkabacteria bacterium]